MTVNNTNQGEQNAGVNSSAETPYQPVTAITENNTHEFDVSIQNKVAASAKTNDHQDTLQNAATPNKSNNQYTEQQN